MNELPTASTSETFGLDRVLQALSADLRAAQEAAVSDGAFGLGLAEAEVALSVTVERERKRGAGGGIKINVIALGGKAESTQSDSTVHHIKLKLVPLGDPADLAPRVSGQPGGGGGVERPLAEPDMGGF